MVGIVTEACFIWWPMEKAGQNQGTTIADLCLQPASAREAEQGHFRSEL